MTDQEARDERMEPCSEECGWCGENLEARGEREAPAGLAAATGAAAEEHEERVRAGLQRYMTDPAFRANVQRITADLEEHTDLPGIHWIEARELFLGMALRAVVAMEALGYRKSPEPEVTDEMVERASVAYSGELVVGSGDGHDAMRAAIEAALRVPVGEGEQQ